MKFAVPMAEGKLTAHFGHCQQLALIEVEEEEIKNTEVLTPPPHEPGVLPRWLGELGANVIIAGGIGQRAISLFNENNIKVCHFINFNLHRPTYLLDNSLLSPSIRPSGRKKCLQY